MGLSRKREGVDMSWGEKAEASPIAADMTKDQREEDLGVDVLQMAEDFSRMDDDLQADFFVEVAQQASRWTRDQASQWFDVGRHLATCECSSPKARELVRIMAMGIDSASGGD